MNSSTQFRRGLYYIHLFFRIPRKGWDEHPSPIAFGVDRPDARVGSSSSLGNPPFHRFKKKRGWWKVESSGNLSSENHLRWSSPSEKCHETTHRGWNGETKTSVFPSVWKDGRRDSGGSLEINDDPQGADVLWQVFLEPGMMSYPITNGTQRW